MVNPARGKPAKSQRWASRIPLTQSKESKKMAEAEPDKVPTHAPIATQKRRFFSKIIEV
jgi:hypothetical protein